MLPAGQTCVLPAGQGLSTRKVSCNYAALWGRHYEYPTTSEQLRLGEGTRTRYPGPPESHAARPNQGLDRDHLPLQVRVEDTEGGGSDASRALDSPEHAEAA